MAAAGVDYTRIWWDARLPRSGHSRSGSPTRRRRLTARPLSWRSCRRSARRRRSPCSHPLDAVEPAAQKLGTWELVETLHGPVEALRQLEVGRANGLEAVAADLVARSRLTMRSARSTCLAARRQRGISIVESLVAFVVLAAGTGRRRRSSKPVAASAADVARERSEAVRIGDRGDRGHALVRRGRRRRRRTTYAAIASGESPSVDASSARARAYRDRASHRRRRLRRDQVRARHACDRNASHQRRLTSRSRYSFIAACRAGVFGLARRSASGAIPGSADAARRPRSRRAARPPQSRRRPQRMEAGRERRHRAACSTTALAPSSAACDGIAADDRDARPLVGRRSPLARADAGCSSPEPIRFASAAPPSATAASDAPFGRRRAHASRRRLSGAGGVLRRGAENRPLRRRRWPADPSTSPLDASAAPRGRRARRWRRSLHRLALHRRAAPRRPLVGADRASSQKAGRSAAAAAARRVCRYASATPAAIDANIASGGATSTSAPP